MPNILSSQVSLQNQRSISCTNITQLVSHTYETCFGKSLFLMETTIFDLKPDALQTLICAFLCLAPQMTSHTKLIHSLGGLDIFLRHKLAHCTATSTYPPQPSPPATDLFCLLIDHDNAQRSLVLNHNAYLSFYYHFFVFAFS